MNLTHEEIEVERERFHRATKLDGRDSFMFSLWIAAKNDAAAEFSTLVEMQPGGTLHQPEAQSAPGAGAVLLNDSADLLESLGQSGGVVTALREAAKAEPIATQEPVAIHQYSAKFSGNWTDTTKAQVERMRKAMDSDRYNFRVIYTAPPAQQEESECTSCPTPRACQYHGRSIQQAGSEFAPLPKVLGVSRDAESPGEKGILVSFKYCLTDDEMRRFHDSIATSRQAVQEDIEERIIAICDAYESGIGHGLQLDGLDNGAAYYTSNMLAAAYTNGYAEGSIRAQQPQQGVAVDASFEQVACMGFDAFRILQGMEPKTYTAQQISTALLGFVAQSSVEQFKYHKIITRNGGPHDDPAPYCVDCKTYRPSFTDDSQCRPSAAPVPAPDSSLISKIKNAIFAIPSEQLCSRDILIHEITKVLGSSIPAPDAIDDRKIADVVNQLREVSFHFQGTGQLRERIADVIVPILKAAPDARDGLETIKLTQQYLVDVVRSFGDISCAAYISTWHKPEMIATAISQPSAAPADACTYPNCICIGGTTSTCSRKSADGVEGAA